MFYPDRDVILVFLLLEQHLHVGLATPLITSSPHRCTSSSLTPSLPCRNNHNTTLCPITLSRLFALSCPFITSSSTLISLPSPVCRLTTPFYFLTTPCLLIIPPHHIHNHPAPSRLAPAHHPAHTASSWYSLISAFSGSRLLLSC